MASVEIVLALALLQFIGMAMMVGVARGKYGVNAPAVSGNEFFERHYRVQMNTLELLVVLVPALLVAAKYWPPAWIAGLGAVYLIGRLIYWRAYVAAPASRGLGFALSFFPVLALVVVALVGALRAAFSG